MLTAQFLLFDGILDFLSELLSENRGYSVNQENAAVPDKYNWIFYLSWISSNLIFTLVGGLCEDHSVLISIHQDLFERDLELNILEIMKKFYIWKIRQSIQQTNYWQNWIYDLWYPQGPLTSVEVKLTFVDDMCSHFCHQLRSRNSRYRLEGQAEILSLKSLNQI